MAESKLKMKILTIGFQQLLNQDWKTVKQIRQVF